MGRKSLTAEDVTGTRDRQAPSRGQGDSRTTGVGPDTAPPTFDNGQSNTHRHRCEGTKVNGQPCPTDMTAEYVTADGSHTWRCRHHRADLLPVSATRPVARRPPVKSLKSKTDAEKFLAWLLDATAQQAYKAETVKALLMIVSRWDHVRARWEDDLLKRMEELHKQLQQVADTFHKEADREREGWEDEDEDNPRVAKLERIATRLDGLLGAWKQAHDAVVDEARERLKEATA